MIKDASCTPSFLVTMKNSKSLWVFPWLYKESFLFVFGIIAIGFILQSYIGGFNFYLLHFPINLGVGALFILGSVAAGYFTSPITLWLRSAHLAVAVSAGFLLLTLIMGLTPQTALHANGELLKDGVGFTQMTTSWAFVLLYSLTLVCLGASCAKKLHRIRSDCFQFLFLHVGLWILLFAAGFGAADIKRYIMHVSVGGIEWRVYAPDNTVLELPLAIKLHRFSIEEYPPKLAIIDKEKGIPLPEDKSEWLQIDQKQLNGRLLDWDITITEYIHQASWAGNGTYRAQPMPGASPAAKLVVRHKENTTRYEGWVSAGNMAQFPSAVSLSDNLAIVMAEPEPKRFLSEVTVVEKDGEKKQADIEVNSPLRMGNWLIYQYGYDDKAGKLSSYSSFELVYDPWLPVVYLGLSLMSIGALLLIWFGAQKRERI